MANRTGAVDIWERWRGHDLEARVLHAARALEAVLSVSQGADTDEWRAARLDAVGEVRELTTALAVQCAIEAQQGSTPDMSLREVARRLRMSAGQIQLWVRAATTRDCPNCGTALGQ